MESSCGKYRKNMSATEAERVLYMLVYMLLDTEKSMSNYHRSYKWLLIS